MFLVNEVDGKPRPHRCRIRKENFEFSFLERDAMSSASVAAVRTVLNQWMAAFNAHDIDALMALYDDEATYVPHASSRKGDLSSIRDSFVSDFAILPRASFREEVVMAEASLGYATGYFSMQGKHPENQSEIRDVGRVVVIFRKSKAGEWKLVFDMDNRPPDVAQLDFSQAISG